MTLVNKHDISRFNLAWFCCLALSGVLAYADAKKAAVANDEFAVQLKVFYFAANANPSFNVAEIEGQSFRADRISLDNVISNPSIGALESGEFSINGVIIRAVNGELVVAADAVSPPTNHERIAIAPSDSQTAAPDVRVLAAPRLIVQAGTEAEIQINQPIQYFVKDADGAFTLHHTQAGCTLNCRITPGSDPEWVTAEWKSTVQTVTGREPIPDVGLDVGAPTIGTRTTNQKQSVRLGWWSFFIAMERDGAVVLQAARITPKTVAKS